MQSQAYTVAAVCEFTYILIMHIHGYLHIHLYLKCLYCLKMYMLIQVWWCMPIVPGTQEIEAGVWLILRLVWVT